MVFVFNYTDTNAEANFFPDDDVYFCKEITDQKKTWFYNMPPYFDWTILRLDRSVVARSPVPVGMVKGEPQVGSNLTLTGHPYGLPMKVADGASVKVSTIGDPIMQVNCDSYAGNSGSMLVSPETGSIEGILVSGNTDFVKQGLGGCYVSNYCSDETGCPAGGQYEQISKAWNFEVFLDNFEGLRLRPQNRHYVSSIDGNNAARVMKIHVENTSDKTISFSSTSVGSTSSIRMLSCGGDVPPQSRAALEIDLPDEWDSPTNEIEIMVKDMESEHLRLLNLVFTPATHIQTEFPDMYFQFPLTATELPLSFTGSISVEDPSFIGFHNCDVTDRKNSRRTKVLAVQFAEHMKIAVDTMQTGLGSDMILAIQSDVESSHPVYFCSDDDSTPGGFSHGGNLVNFEVRPDTWYFIHVASTNIHSSDSDFTLRFAVDDTPIYDRVSASQWNWPQWDTVELEHPLWCSETGNNSPNAPLSGDLPDAWNLPDARKPPDDLLDPLTECELGVCGAAASLTWAPTAWFALFTAIMAIYR